MLYEQNLMSSNSVSSQTKQSCDLSASLGFETSHVLQSLSLDSEIVLSQLGVVQTQHDCPSGNDGVLYLEAEAQ